MKLLLGVLFVAAILGSYHAGQNNSDISCAKSVKEHRVKYHSVALGETNRDYD